MCGIPHVPLLHLIKTGSVAAWAEGVWTTGLCKYPPPQECSLSTLLQSCLSENMKIGFYSMTTNGSPDTVQSVYCRLNSSWIISPSHIRLDGSFIPIDIIQWTIESGCCYCRVAAPTPCLMEKISQLLGVQCMFAFLMLLTLQGPNLTKTCCLASCHCCPPQANG